MAQRSFRKIAEVGEHTVVRPDLDKIDAALGEVKGE